MSEYETNMEAVPSSGGYSSTKNVTLKDAVEMGEYDPEYLSRFAEWHTLSKTMQWSFIEKALDNAERHLVQQWAVVNNVLDFRLKPELQIALRNIEAKRHKVLDDREKLLLKYSSQ
ncbi:MAG: hypothetical protein WCL07_04105 [bacterium]